MATASAGPPVERTCPRGGSRVEGGRRSGRRCGRVSDQRRFIGGGGGAGGAARAAGAVAGAAAGGRRSVVRGGPVYTSASASASTDRAARRARSTRTTAASPTTIQIFAGDELYVSMTLVSTYDGRVLWHAREPGSRGEQPARTSIGWCRRSSTRSPPAPAAAPAGAAAVAVPRGRPAAHRRQPVTDARRLPPRASRRPVPALHRRDVGALLVLRDEAPCWCCSWPTARAGGWAGPSPPPDRLFGLYGFLLPTRCRSRGGYIADRFWSGRTGQWSSGRSSSPRGTSAWPLPRRRPFPRAGAGGHRHGVLQGQRLDDGRSALRRARSAARQRLHHLLHGGERRRVARPVRLRLLRREPALGVALRLRGGGRRHAAGAGVLSALQGQVPARHRR